MLRNLGNSTRRLLRLAPGFLIMPALLMAQEAPSTATGEWPHYTSDLKGSRYSPLDQINAENFADLEIAWSFKTDNLGSRPEYKLEGTPLMIDGVLYTTAGTRRAAIALDAATGELIWMHSLREGRRGGFAPRQLSGRGLAYWTDGDGDARVLYVTPGYRLIALDADTGTPIEQFGENGIVDLKVGVVYGADEPIDLETGEIGLHSTPTVAGNVVLVGSAMKEGMTITTSNNTKGLVRAFDVRTGERQWKRGRYRHGQLILVDDLLLIQAESGEVALVDANPKEFRELSRFPALNDRTWNHPALAGRILVVRNDHEAACFELPVQENSRLAGLQSPETSSSKAEE